MRILITAGPTREAIDDVRFISNRSSGRLGCALAQAAIKAGHPTTLLLGPGVQFPSMDASPAGKPLTIEHFTSAADLQARLAATFPEHDVLIMAAAVADYRPARRITGKLPRNPEGQLQLTLEPTPDLVAELAATRQTDQTIIAFALGPAATLRQRAQEKLACKNVDAIVANPLETMDSGDIDATWLGRDGTVAAPGAMAKADFAAWLIARTEALWSRRPAP